MSDPIDGMIARVIEREGGYSNRATDAGGPTKFGITLATLSAWRRPRPVTAADVEALGTDEAAAIYRSEYFLKTGFDQVKDPALQEFLFDFGVNSGVGEASEALQRAIGAAPDGVVGPKSLATLAAITNHAALFYAVKAERLDFLLRDVGSYPDQAEYAIGWSNRLRPFVVPLK